MGPELPSLDDHWSGVLCVEYCPRIRYVTIDLVLDKGSGADMWTVVRYILVAENKRLDKSEAEEMSEAERERIKEAARLEGLTLDEAMERKKGFRYLY